MTLSLRISNGFKLVQRPSIRTATAIPAQQCRALNLYLIALKRDLRNHKIKNFDRYTNYTPPRHVKLDLWSKEPLKHIKRTSLADVLENHIKPGVLLVPLVDEASGKLQDNQYTLWELPAVERVKMSNSMKRKTLDLRGRRAKSVHFNTDVPALHFADMMWRAWCMLASKLVVEFHIRLKKPLETKDDALFDQALGHRNTIHLRPDVMLKCFGEQYKNVINPWADRKGLCSWVSSHESGRGNKVSDKWVLRSKERQLQLDEVGGGIPVYEERKRMKAELKAEPGYQTHNDKRREAFAHLRSTNPAIAPVIERLTYKWNTAAEILAIAEAYQSQQQILSRLAEVDPAVFQEVRYKIKPIDRPNEVRLKINEARKRLQQADFEARNRSKHNPQQFFNERILDSKVDEYKRNAPTRSSSFAKREGVASRPVRFVGPGDTNNATLSTRRQVPLANPSRS